MRWSVLLLLCGCDRALQLGATVPADGTREFFDAHLATGCPLPGTTPTYSPQLVQDIVQTCVGYTSSATLGIGMAVCIPDTGNFFTGVGAIDGPLAPATGIDDPLCSTDDLQISESGTAYVTCFDTVDSMIEYRSFTRRLDGSWARGLDVLAAANVHHIVAAATNTTPRHLVYLSGTDGMVHEATGDIGAWTDRGNPTPQSALGVVGISWMRLSADGLRMTMFGFTDVSNNERALYTDRAKLADSFRPVTAMPGVPPAIAALSEDCTRAYVTGLGSILYLQEIVP